MHILLLGGTTEASQMARRLAQTGLKATFSYAGRTQSPVTQPLPQRIGGFGGVAGLVDHITAHAVTHVVDATHPFAAGMSQNAHTACTQTGTPLIRLERPPWQPQAGDRWHSVPSMEDLPTALPDDPARIFLAIGKQQIGLFAPYPQHHYLLRLVDAPDAPLPLPNTTVVLARGPFRLKDDTALLRDHRITHVICKNAGGSGAQAKLDAARALGLPVIMADRPNLPGDTVANSVDQVMAWLGHEAERGV